MTTKKTKDNSHIFLTNFTSLPLLNPPFAENRFDPAQNPVQSKRIKKKRDKNGNFMDEDLFI
ncbi:MAG: hypothetical protein ABIA04_12180 [Pseudomonadota bacterium]